MSERQSEACCTVPPVQAKDYKEKGKYIDVDGTKCYVTGPSSASSAILLIYDIFGFSPQTLQGADILAYGTTSSSTPPDHENHKEYQVFVPDFFHGKPIPLSIYPPRSESDKKAIGAFFAGPAGLDKNVAAVHALVSALTKQSSGTIKKWGSLGQCWGGKIVSLTASSSSDKKTPFSAAAEVHPAMIAPQDASSISIPTCMLASGDEDAEAVKGFEAELEKRGVERHVEIFGDQIHGWMAARADLEDERVKGEYARGYGILRDFYGRYL